MYSVGREEANEILDSCNFRGRMNKPSPFPPIALTGVLMEAALMNEEAALMVDFECYSWRFSLSS
jgi:hypothetical protein